MKTFRFIKRNIIEIFFIVFIIMLVIFSKSIMGVTKESIKMWADSVVPALFPFFVATELLNNTNIVSYLSMILNNVMRPVFNLPGSSSYAFIMGLISGYPVGGKIVCDLYKKGECTKDEAERMLAFTNNSGPLFVIGTVGVGFYGNSKIGIILWITHIISAIIVGIILGLLSKKKTNYNNHVTINNNNMKISELGEILGNAILSGIKSVFIVGGFVVFFSIIVFMMKKTGVIIVIADQISKICNISKELVLGIIVGIVEFTNGLSIVATNNIKQISISIAMSSFFIGFGGISVLLQVLSIISKEDLSIKKYFFGKIAQGIISTCLIILLLNIPIFNLNL